MDIIYEMDFRGLDLNLLLVLNVLHAERSATRAARRLNVSQPTISFSLNKLREHFDDDLFVRHGAAMTPTPLAERLAEPVDRIITAIGEEVLRDWRFDPRTTERTFSFSMSDIGELVFLPPLLAALREEAPQARVRCLSMPPDALQEELASGSIDIALGYFPDLVGPGMYQQGLFLHPFTCLVREDHPLIGDTITMEQFLAADHAVVSEKGRSQEIAERRIADMRLGRRVVLHSPHFMSVPLIVANSDIVSIVPRAVGQAYARNARLKLVEPPMPIPQIELKQFWHSRVHNDSAVVWLRVLIARLYLGRDPSADPTSPIFAARDAS